MGEKKYLEGTKIEDLTGNKFNKLTVVSFDWDRYEKDKIKRKNGEISQLRGYWICKCSCGGESSIETYNVKHEKIFSCGCELRTTPQNFKDLTNRKIGRWTVLSRSKDDLKKWTCRCDCGSIVDVAAASLNSNKSLSCGCIPSENKLKSIIKNANKGNSIYDFLKQNNYSHINTLQHLNSIKLKDISKGTSKVKIIYECEMCGEKETRTPNKIMDSHNKCGKFVCKKCSVIIRADKRSNNFEDIKKEFISLGYTVIGDYTGCSNPIEFIDGDGYKYYSSYANTILKKRLPMLFGKQNKFTIDNIRNYIKLNNIDAELVSNNYVSNTRKMLWECSCGEKYSACWNDFYVTKKHQCTPCGRYNAQNDKRYTIEYVKEYVKAVSESDYIVLSDDYVGCNDKLRVKHVSCGHEYDVSFMSFKLGRRCPKCASLLKVSYTHAVLSLLFERYFYGVEFEYDAGAKSKKGNVCPYDLYVESLNLLIEWQSAYHDSENRKSIDKIKREYAINNGYNFLALDHRDFKTLEYVKMFFPFLEYIPKDLGVERFFKLDYIKAQELLDSGMSVMDVANEMGVKYHIVNSALRNNLTLPIDYKKKQGYITPVVKLNNKLEYLDEYESVNKASNHNRGNIMKSVKNHSMSCGYFWVKKDDFVTGEYKNFCFK